MLRKIYAVVLLIFVHTLGAQVIEFTAKIIDSETQLPVSNATLYAGSKACQKQSTNLYSCSISDGLTLLQVKAFGYNNTSIKIPKNKSEVLIILPPSVKNLKEVHITYAPNGVNKASAWSPQRLDKEQKTQNLAESLEKIAGFSILKSGSEIGKPVFRGITGSRLPVLFGNTRLREQDWGQEHAPPISPQDFSKVVVLKGAQSLAAAGDSSLGSLVLLEDDYLKKDSLGGQISGHYYSSNTAGSLSAEILISKKDSHFVKVSGSSSMSGDIKTPEGFMENTAATRNNFRLYAGKKIGSWDAVFSLTLYGQELGIFRGAYLKTPEDFYKVISSGGAVLNNKRNFEIKNPRQEIFHSAADAKIHRDFASGDHLDIIVSSQLNLRKEYENRIGMYQGKPAIDLSLQSHDGNIQYNFKRGKYSFTTGASGLYQSNYSNPETGKTPLIPDYVKYKFGGFAGTSFYVNATKIETAIRYDYSTVSAQKYYNSSDWAKYADIFPNFVKEVNNNRIYTRPQLDFSLLSASLEASRRFGSHFNADIVMKLSAREPNPAELFADGLHFSAAVIERGLLTAKPEKGIHVETNLNWKFGETIPVEFSIHPHYSYWTNYLIQIPTGSVSGINGTFPVWEFQQNKAEMWGLQMLYNVKFSPYISLLGNISYENGRIQLDNNTTEALPFLPPLQVRSELDFKIPHTKFSGSITSVYVDIPRHYPDWKIPVDVIENNTLSTKNLDLNVPTKAYSLWHASVDYTFNKNSTLSLSAHNILNTNYRDYNNRWRYFSPEMGRNIGIGYQYNF